MSKRNIGDAIAATLASVPEAAPDTERTIEVITSEILRLKAETGERLIAIGQRLIEAKAMLAHGEWLPWLEHNVEMSEKTAQDFMRIAREFSNPQALADLGKTKVLKLLLLPAAEREEFLAEHDVAGMSTRELEQAIRERDEARAEADRARRDEAAAQLTIKTISGKAEQDRAEAENLREELAKLKAAPKELYRDEAAIAEAAAQATEAADKAWTEKLWDLNAELVKANAAADEAKAALAKAEEKAKKAKDKLKTADEDAAKKNAAELDAAKKAEADARAEVEKLRAELDAAKEAAAKAKIAGDGDLALVQSYAEELVSYANKLNGIRKKAQANGNDVLADKVGAILKTVTEQIGGLVK